jgi:hypothetical protein
MLEDESLEGNTIIKNKNLQAYTHLLMKEVEEKDDLFVFLPSAILLFTTI